MTSLRTLLLISLLASTCTGCCAGHLASRSEFEKLHPSVRWAYRSGGQLGLSWGVPAIIRQRIIDMHLGSGRVIVKEGGPGGDTTAPWEQTVALSLTDGRRMWACKAIEDESHWTGGTWDGKDRVFFQIPNGLRAYVTIPDTRELFIGKSYWSPSRYIRVARLPKGQGFESSLHVISADQNTLILGLWGGHVLCIDPTLMPELTEPSSAPTASPQNR